MTDFAINPPIHLGGSESIVRSVEQAVGFVRECAMAALDADTSELLRRLESVRSAEQAQTAGRAFREWLKRRDLLLVPPDRR